MQAVFNNLRAPCLALNFSALSMVAMQLITTSLPAQAGYGYRKGQDPLVLSVKKIILATRRGTWSSAEEEWRNLRWQFQELQKDLDVHLGSSFLAALKRRSMPTLSREISRLLYHAIAQKFFWNEKERLKFYVKARSRADAALYYYEEILSLGVRNFDRSRQTEHHRKILLEFRALRRSVGSAGLFGFQARPPDLEEFRTRRTRILKFLADVYPHVRASTRVKT